MRSKTINFLSVLALTCSLTACSSDDEEKILDDTTTPPEVLYNDAQDALASENFKTAAKDFLEVERQHPYSKWAAQAQVQAAYAYYSDEKYDDAINTLERFIKLNPGNPDVPYAYYLIALSYYNQISDVGRDQEMTMKARSSLNGVVSRYPNTDYGRDAKFKLDLVEDHLAGKEMEVGRYYLNRRDYIGAVNRFKKVVEEYPTTAQVEEALYRLTEGYLSLGIVPEAQKYAAVLGHNYPGSKWYKDSYDLLITGEREVRASTDSSEAWYEFW